MRCCLGSVVAMGMLAVGAIMAMGAAQAPAEAPAAAEADAAVKEVADYADRITQEKQPVNVIAAFKAVERLTKSAAALDEEHRKIAIAKMGLILNFKGKIEIDWGGRQPMGQDPRSILRWKIVDAFAAIGDKRAVPHLVTFFGSFPPDAYILDPGGGAAGVAGLIRKLGGDVPDTSLGANAIKAAKLTKEVADTAAAMVDKKTPIFMRGLMETISRLREFTVGLNDEQKKTAIEAMGRMLNFKGKIDVDWNGMVPMGDVSKDALDEYILAAMENFGDKRAVPELARFVESVPADVIENNPKSNAARAARLLEKLGGKAKGPVPPK